AGDQSAIDALERLSDCAARMARLAARGPPQRGFPRHARGRCVAGARQSVAGAIVTWLIKLGDWIRDLTAAGSRRAIRELLEFQVKTAWVVRDGALVFIPSGELTVGDEVVVHHGGLIPIDGEIIAGQALIDQKTITGEGLPVTRGKGDTA